MPELETAAGVTGCVVLALVAADDPPLEVVLAGAVIELALEAEEVVDVDCKAEELERLPLDDEPD